MPCEICGSTTKKPNSKSHINTKTHQAALKKLGISSTISLKTKTLPIPKTKTKTLPIPTKDVGALDISTIEPMIEKIISKRIEPLENRILELEKLIKSNKSETIEIREIDKKKFQERLRYHYDTINTQERRGGMVPIPKLWDKLQLDGFNRENFVNGLFELELLRIIELQTASDPKIVRDVEKSIKHPSRGLINYVIWRR